MCCVIKVAVVVPSAHSKANQTMNHDPCFEGISVMVSLSYPIYLEREAVYAYQAIFHLNERHSVSFCQYFTLKYAFLCKESFVLMQNSFPT
jgi:hypothetical protein